MSLTHARTEYLLNAYTLYCIYTGRDPDGLNLPIECTRLKRPTHAVLRLVSCIERTNKNITTDNQCTSIELANCLNDKQLTVLGTTRKNLREKNTIRILTFTSETVTYDFTSLQLPIFGFTRSHITITYFVLKKNKALGRNFKHAPCSKC